MRQRGEGVERRAHVELAIAVQQGEVDGNAARMRRATARIGQELGVRPGLPQRPLRLDRPQGVEDAQPKPERPGKGDRRGELVGGFTMQPAFGIPVDRLPR